jgi:hypothetical protein
LPDGEIVELVATGGIGDFEIDHCVTVVAVTHIGGKHGQSILGGSPSFFDGFEGIDGKGMAQAMGSGRIEDDIAEFFSWLGDPHLSYGMVEERSDPWTRERMEVFTGQEIGILILGAEVCTDGEIVFHLLEDGLGKGDQSVFSELGFFDVDRPLFLSIMVLEQMQGLRDSQAASGHEHDGDAEGKLLEEGGFTSLHSFAEGLEELIGLLGREDERDDNLFFEGRDIEEGIFLKDSSSHQETEEAPGDGEHVVDGDRLHDEIGSHVKEEGRVQGVPIGSTLMHIAIKETKVTITGPQGISQAFSIPEIVVKVWGKETLKGFHRKGPFSSDRHGCGDTFASSRSHRVPASL